MTPIRRSEASTAPSPWLVLVLFPLLLAGSIKAAGITELAGVDPTLLGLALVVVATGLQFVRRPSYPFGRMIPFFAFFLVSLVSTARSEPSLYFESKLRDFSVVFLLAFCLPVLVQGEATWRALIRLWFGAGVLVSTLILIVGADASLYGRGGIGESTLGPALIASSGLVAGTSSLGERLLPVYVALPGVLLCGVALIGVGSRGPLLGAVVGLMVWALMRGAFRRGTVIVFLLAGLAAYVGLRLAPSVALARYVLEDAARTSLWTAAWETFQDYPLLGVGWANYSTVSTVDEYPHNFMLEAASEMGILGLLAALWLLTASIRRAWSGRSVPAVRGVAAIAAGMTADQMVSSDVTNRLFWIALIPCLLSPPSRPVAPTPLPDGADSHRPHDVAGDEPLRRDYPAKR